MVDDAPPRMLPTLDQHNRAFWTGGGGEALMIGWCAGCGRWAPPPAADCPDCGGALEPRPVSGRGTVFTYTVNHQPFHPAVPVPYVIAIVELEEQADLRLAANIVGCDPSAVRVGLAVEVRFEAQDIDGERAFVPVFAPRQG